MMNKDNRSGQSRRSGSGRRIADVPGRRINRRRKADRIGKHRDQRKQPR